MEYQPMEQSESKSGLGIAVVVLVIAGLVGWYFYSTPSSYAPSDAEPAEQVSADSDADVASDLEQVPDDAALDSDADSLDKEIQGL